MSNYQVIINYGDGDVDLTNYSGVNLVRQDSFSKTTSLYRDLEPVADKARFTVDFRQALANDLLSVEWDQVVTVEINKDSTAWFTGIIRPITTYDISEDRVIQIEALDNSWRLARKPASAGRRDNESVTDLVDFVLTQCGYSADERSQIPTISTTISAFLYDTKTEWKKILTQLLYAYGYVWYFDEAGRFRAASWITDSITVSSSVGEAQMLNRLQVSRDDERVGLIADPDAGTEEIRVPVYAPVTREEVLFTASPGWQRVTFDTAYTYSGRFGIDDDDPIFSVENFRAEVRRREVGKIFGITQYTNYRTAVFTGDDQSEHGVGTEAWSIGDDSFTIAVDRTQSNFNPFTILEFSVGDFTLYADVTAREQIDEVAITVPKGFGQVVGDYVEDVSTARRIAQTLSDRLDTAIYSYEFQSETDYAVGAFLTLTNTALNISTTVRVIEKVTTDVDGHVIYDYVCEGAAELSPLVASVTGNSGTVRFTGSAVGSAVRRVQAGLGANGEVTQPISGPSIQTEFDVDGEMVAFAPDETGLYFDATDLGFYDAGSDSWPVHLQNDSGVGKAYFGNGSDRYMQWDGTDLTITGAANIGGKITAGDGIESDDYVAGSSGWRIDGDGDVEFSSGTFRGSLDADSGTIGGWNINGTSIYTDGATLSSVDGVEVVKGRVGRWVIDNASLADINGRILLRPDQRRLEIRDATDAVKIALGYLGDIDDFADTQYGLYIGDGNAVNIAGGVTYDDGDFSIQKDGAVTIAGEGGVELGRFGSLGSGDLGFYVGSGASYSVVVTGGGGAAGTFEDSVTGGAGAAGFTVPASFAATLTGGGDSDDTYEAELTGGGLASDIMEQELIGGAGATTTALILTEFGDLIGGGPAGGTGIKYSLDDKSLLLRGTVKAEQLYAFNLPISPVGLEPGRVWNDGGTLKVVE